METKKSKVNRILHNVRQWNSPNGTIYYHTIAFENGDCGDYGSKSETCTKFAEGAEATYSIETKVNGQYTNVIIKPVQEFIPSPGFKRGASGSDESFALSYAKDYICTKIENGGQGISESDVIKAAEIFYNWLKEKK